MSEERQKENKDGIEEGHHEGTKVGDNER